MTDNQHLPTRLLSQFLPMSSPPTQRSFSKCTEMFEEFNPLTGMSSCG